MVILQPNPGRAEAGDGRHDQGGAGPDAQKPKACISIGTGP